MSSPTGTASGSYTSKLNKMRIRIKIIILGLITISLLTSVSIEKYKDIDRLEREGESNIAKSILLGYYSVLIQELQRERGMSYGPLNLQEPLIAKVINQRHKTDIALENLIKIDPKEKRLAEELHGNRSLAHNNTSNFNIIFSNYTLMISQYLEKASFLTFSNPNTQILSLINSCKKVLLAKECLGQIRALIFRTYQDNKVSRENIDKIYFLFSNYTHYINELTDTGSSYFSKTIKAYSNLQTTRHIYHIINEIIINKLPNATPEEWFADCTQSIDDLQQLCEFGLRNLMDTLHTNAARLHRDSLLEIAAYTALTLSTLFLTTIILFRIYMPIKTIVHFVDKTIKTGNYNDNINLHENNEFGTISDSIDTLIDYSKKLMAEKDYIAYHDALTGAYNRHKLLELFAKELNRSKRYGHTFSFIILDIDHFKNVNDTHGHQTGDLVLKELASVINDNLRTNDTLARWGGEEFVLLIPETEKDGALHVSEKIRSAIEENEFPVAKRITISLGVTIYAQGDSLETMCARADKALYRSKEDGRNRATFL